MSTVRALLPALLLLSGCATTSGRAWIDSPIEERTAPASVELAQLEPRPDARPRLSHTVTLGETYAAVPASASGGTPGAPGVQVNVTTQVPVTIHNGGGYGYYGGYGYGYPVSRSVTPSGGVVRSTAASGGAPQTVGGNWPAIPDYGPKAMR